MKLIYIKTNKKVVKVEHYSRDRIIKQIANRKIKIADKVEICNCKMKFKS